MSNDDQKVTLDLENGIAVITINNPPINAGSFAVRKGVVEALKTAQEDGATGAVLTGAGKVFIAGSDLKEFGAPLAYPELPDVIRAVEDAPFPVVAAMHGVALGGGYELALGCDYRVAAPGTKIGLPEVSLGMVPGAGGTQRLTKLVGQSRAIELICGAKRIGAELAAEYGAIDHVVDGDLVAGAKEFLIAQNGAKRHVIKENVPAEEQAAIDSAAKAAIKRGNNRPNIEEAIRLVKLATSDDYEAALKDERASFQDLRMSPDAFALRHIFFSERRAGTVDGLNQSAARRVSRVGVVGGGTMGQGIAKAALAAGLPVAIAERDDAALDKAMGAIASSLDGLAAKGILSAEVAQKRKAAVHGVTSLAGLADCDLVIEAVFEDMDVKRSVLADLEAALPADAIIATNTSYLDINVMSEGLKHPERVLGLHFFSPADRMALLEIVRTNDTSDATLATGLGFAKTLKKQPVVTRVAEGFVGNRIYAAYRRRAELLVLDGANPQDVDAAVREFGFKMGPFEVSDMSGLDIAWAMRKRLAATRDPADRYVTIPDKLCEAGRLGRKTGKGWYDYATGKGEVDAEVDALIETARQEAGITPRAYDHETIQRQLLITMVNEATCLIEEGIAQRDTDVDVVLVNGYGFPRWCGGPIYWAAQQDPKTIDEDMSALKTGIGHGFRAGPVADILEQFRTTAKAG